VLINYLKRNFPCATYHAVYEAGYAGFWIHDRLRDLGVVALKDGSRNPMVKTFTLLSYFCYL
jgi:hypothetical protein